MITQVLSEQVAVVRTPQSAAPQVADVLATVPAWWERRAASAGLQLPWLDWRRALKQPPCELNGHPVPWLFDATAEEIGDEYVRAQASGVRLAEGRHYTPAKLAKELWQMLLAVAGDATPARVVDPAAGAAALLLPAVREIVRASPAPELALASIETHVAGTDIDPLAVWLGNAFIAAELLPVWAALPHGQRHQLPALLSVADGLAKMDDAPNAIVMNPPYGRVRLPARDRARWARSLYGHSNRYTMFLHAAIERVATGGLIGAVLPTSFLGGAYFQRLREMVAEVAPLVSLAFVDTRSGVYSGDPLQETCLAIFRKGAKKRVVFCRRLSANGDMHPQTLGDVAIRPPFGAPWPLPRRPHDTNLISAASRLNDRLTDYGWSVTTGPLVWNRHKSQIGAWGNGRIPILWAADIGPDGVHRDRSRDHQRWIRLRPRDSFMRLSTPAVLVQRTTAPEQARRLVGAVMDVPALAAWGGTVVVENHVNVLRQSRVGSPLDARLLAALLATPTFDSLYRCLTGSVAVSAYELEALPFPPRDVLTVWASHAESELAAAVARYYGE